VVNPEGVRGSAGLEFLGHAEKLEIGYNRGVFLRWVVVDEPNLAWELGQRVLQIIQESGENSSLERPRQSYGPASGRNTTR
jgi:hypothetical protein